MPQGDGSPLREHLQAAERATRRRHERLYVRCPEALRHVWEWFVDLHSARGWVDGTPMAITHAEMVAWESLNRIRLTPREVRVIRKLDAEFLSIVAKNRKRNRG